MSLKDLLSGSRLTVPTASAPVLFAATVVDVSPLRVIAPSIDGGKHAIAAFGSVPVGTVEGDEVRAMIDENGDAVVVAWGNT